MVWGGNISRLNMSIQAALSVWWFVLQRFTITAVLIPERQNYHLKKCKKICNYKYCTWCKETAQPIRDESYPHYHLSQSGMSLIKLLKQKPPCLLREVRWSQMNVKKLLKSHIYYVGRGGGGSSYNGRWLDTSHCMQKYELASIDCGYRNEKWR